MFRRLAILLALAALAGCASDRRLVADASAAYTYAETHYEWNCVSVKGPPECKKEQLGLKEAKREIVLCNDVQKVGKLPPVARKRLKAIKKDLPK